MSRAYVEGVRLELQRLQRLLRGRGGWAALAAAASIDLAQQEIQILLALGDGHRRSMAELARLLGMDAAAVSRQVASLEERGMVARAAGPGRVVLVEANTEGLDRSRRVRDLYDQHISDALASWDPEERNQLVRLLGRLVDDFERTPYRQHQQTRTRS